MKIKYILFLFSWSFFSCHNYLPNNELTTVKKGFVLNYETWVLSLEESGDAKTDKITKARWPKVKKVLDDEGISFKKFSGIYGKKFKNKVNLLNSGVQKFGPDQKYSYEKRKTPGHSRDLSYGELGHLISFYEMYEKIKNQSKDIVILEDKVEASYKGETLKRLETLLSYAPKGWDVIYLFCHGKHKDLLEDRRFSLVSSNINDWMGNVAQIVSPEGAKKLHGMMLPFYIPTDHWINSTFKKGVKAYCAYPEIFDYDHSYKTQVDPEGKR